MTMQANEAKPSGTQEPSALGPAQNDSKALLFWVLGAAMGVGAGVTFVVVDDPILAVVIVLLATMVLGTARPTRPWRWLLAVGVPIPLVPIVANVTGLYPAYTQATSLWSVLIALSGIAGAFGGSVMRRAITAVLSEKDH
jgi:hypothetical protein